YAAGARIFVEVGPRNVLSGLVRNILGSRPYSAIATDAPGRSGITQVQSALAQLATNGVFVRPSALFSHRKARLLDLNRLIEDTRPAPRPATAWMVNGSRAWPHNQAPPVVRRASLQPAQPMQTASTATVPAPLPVAQMHATAIDGSAPSDDVMLQFQNLMSKFLDTQ